MLVARRRAAWSGGSLMAIWQWALLGLVVAWAIQSIGVWLQMRHYSDVLKGITEKYEDGYVGAGHVRGRFAKGTIALLVVTPDLVVRRLMTMSGRSVFTKFKRHEAFEGVALERIRANPAIFGEKQKGAAEAVRQAVEQIDRVRADPERRPGLSGIKTANA
jgi:glucitol operon activator protein